MEDLEWANFSIEVNKRKADLDIFKDGIEKHFLTHPDLEKNGNSVVHSTKSRLKEESHIREKIERKIADGRSINTENFWEEITDVAGVRLLLLFQQDFGLIDASIRRKVEEGDWVLGEKAKAFTWDPEASSYFQEFDLSIERRETFYTSVHYLIRPRADSPLCCEIQVRTLFEEIWGEIDHRINYPNATDRLVLREQLMVLSKIAGAGSRLVDSIQRTIEEN